MDIWFKLNQKIRFLIIGGINAGISYLIYALICFMFGSEIYQIALIIAWVLSSVTSFCLQKYLVFRSSGNYIKEYLKCCGSWFFTYMVNALLLESLVSVFNVNIFLAQLISTFIAAIVTYILFKFMVFKQKK